MMFSYHRETWRGLEARSGLTRGVIYGTAGPAGPQGLGFQMVNSMQGHLVAWCESLLMASLLL